MDMISTLLKTEKSVFTLAELQDIFVDMTYKNLTTTLLRYKKQEKLLNPQKGIWMLPVFSEEELACVLYPRGYISMETVLYDAGVIFQWYGSSTRVVRSNTREKIFHDHHYIARKIKDSILSNPLGVRQYHHCRKATPERALCDLLYLQKKVQIDNPQFFQNPQSQVRLEELLPLYPQTVQDNVKKILLTKI